ncbi:MAG: hypothetical protein AMXMBFR47_38150 [Planctomycetota bacterium]
MPEAAKSAAPPLVSIPLHRVIAIVLLVGGVVRLIALASLPLIVTNDGTEYAYMAHGLREGRMTVARPDRTPGYPAMIAATHWVLGDGAVPIRIMQHVLGLAACAALAWAAARVSGPVAGLVVGLLAALDPWLLGFECYLLTETPATAGFVLIASLTIVPWRRPMLRCAVVGLALAALCLVRPSFQIVVPFLLAAAALPGAGVSWRSLGRLAVGGAAFVAGVAPWAVHNYQASGSFALARGSGAHLFSGVARAGLLDESFELPANIRAAYAPYAGKPMGDSEYWAFFKAIGGLDQSEPLLKNWAIASIRANLPGYLTAVRHSLAWQLNAAFAGSPIGDDELREYMLRVTQAGDGRHHEAGEGVGYLESLRQSAEGGGVRPILRSVYARAPRTWPQVPLAAAALLLLLVAAIRRQAALFWVLAGTFAFVVFHALFLFPNARYAMPVWIFWYLGPPVIVQWIVAAGVRGRRARTAEGECAATRDTSKQ